MLVSVTINFSLAVISNVKFSTFIKLLALLGIHLNHCASLYSLAVFLATILQCIYSHLTDKETEAHGD